jgi:hypothetical protein
MSTHHVLVSSPPSTEGKTPSPALFTLLVTLLTPREPPATRLHVAFTVSEVETAGLDLRMLLQEGYVEEVIDDDLDTLPDGANNGLYPGSFLRLTENGLTRVSELLVSLAERVVQGAAISGPSQDALRPRWVAREEGGGALWLGEELLLKRIRHDAASQCSVLENLEQRGWPVWLPNPLPGGRGRKRALRDTVRRLNRGQHPQRVRFHVYDGGIRWEIIE